MSEGSEQGSNHLGESSVYLEPPNLLIFRAVAAPIRFFEIEEQARAQIEERQHLTLGERKG